MPITVLVMNVLSLYNALAVGRVQIVLGNILGIASDLSAYLLAVAVAFLQVTTLTRVGATRSAP